MRRPLRTVWAKFRMTDLVCSVPSWFFAAVHMGFAVSGRVPASAHRVGQVSLVGFGLFGAINAAGSA